MLCLAEKWCLRKDSSPILILFPFFIHQMWVVIKGRSKRMVSCTLTSHSFSLTTEQSFLLSFYDLRGWKVDDYVGWGEPPSISLFILIFYLPSLIIHKVENSSPFPLRISHALRKMKLEVVWSIVIWGINDNKLRGEMAERTSYFCMKSITSSCPWTRALAVTKETQAKIECHRT